MRTHMPTPPGRPAMPIHRRVLGRRLSWYDLEPGLEAWAAVQREMPRWHWVLPPPWIYGEPENRMFLLWQTGEGKPRVELVIRPDGDWAWGDLRGLSHWVDADAGEVPAGIVPVLRTVDRPAWYVSPPPMPGYKWQATIALDEAGDWCCIRGRL